MGSIPTLNQLKNYRVNTNDVEGIKWSLYDRQAYPQPGTAQLQFFQDPKGAGGKTYADTNMLSAGQMPRYTNFLITGIQLFFFPAANAYTTQANPAAAPAAAQEFVNDVVTFYQSRAFLELDIGQKPYLFEAPLMKFPPANGIVGFAALADSTTAGAAQLTSIQYAAAGGSPYEVDPGLLLEENQNFSVDLTWPALVPISAAANVFCQLDGFLYRSAQ